jgi:hypothetical protein
MENNCRAFVSSRFMVCVKKDTYKSTSDTDLNGENVYKSHAVWFFITASMEAAIVHVWILIRFRFSIKLLVSIMEILIIERIGNSGLGFF